MMSAVSSGGEFWRLENPDLRVRGEFTADVGQKVQAALEAALPAGLGAGTALAPVPVPAFERGDMAGAMRAHAAGSVARHRAIPLWGQLDNGDPVSVLDAIDYGGSGMPPDYVAHVAVLGAHVTLDQHYSTVRFHLDHPYRLSHLTDKESRVVEDDQSTLSVEASDEGNWLVYTSSTPATLRQLEIRAISGCLALAQLALLPDPERDLCTRQTQVRIDSNSPWLTVCGPAFCAEPHNPRLDTLLPHTELTVERFAKWIVINDKFDGLAWAVAHRMNVPVQLQVQLLTSLVEGFHRRLTPPRDQTWFPDATKAALQRVREAAAQAAVDQAHKEGLDPQVMGTRVMNALGHVGDKSFLERAEEVVARVCAAVPEIGVSITTLASRLTNPRHSFAHQLPQDNAKDPLEDRITRWVVVSSVTPWLLRALLLLEVGVDAQILREKYLENERFAFARVNTELRVRELGWDKPPDGPKQKQRRWTPSTDS
jgi:hypothetical protein